MIRDLELPDWFTRTRPGREAVQEAENARLQRRRVLADRIAELEVEKSRRLPPLREAWETARSQVEEAREALQAAKRGEEDAHRAFHGADHQLRHRIRKAEGELRRTASEACERFRDWCWTEFEATRRVRFDSANRIRRNAYGDEYVDGEVTNQAGIVARLDAIREASAAAEALKLEALDDAELEARLEELRDGIPDIPPPEAFLSPKERTIAEEVEAGRRNGDAG